MLVFIDESGHPHPRDRSTRPVVVAVCFREEYSRQLSAALYGLKRDLLGPTYAELELKAHDFLTPRTFRRMPAHKELVEGVFQLIRESPLFVFAVIMERPRRVIARQSPLLPAHFRFLLQRVHLLGMQEEDTAVLLFDGDGSQYGKLAIKFANFLQRSLEGQSFLRVADAPFFVDSRFTPGIQIADLIAATIRIYHEQQLRRRVPPGDYFLAAIARYYAILRAKTKDTYTPDGQARFGLYFMPEELHYPLEEAPEEPQGGESGPNNTGSQT